MCLKKKDQRIVALVMWTLDVENPTTTLTNEMVTSQSLSWCVL